MEFLIVCPLAFLAGFVDAIAGGGGLISLPAYLFAGVPVHMALGTNKLSNSMGTFLATVRYALQGYMVLPFIAVAVPCGLLGSVGGGNLALSADDSIIRLAMLVTLPFVAFFVLRNRNLDRFAEDPIGRSRALILTGVISAAVGVYDGFYGPGTGTFLLLLLTAFAHQDVRTAQGTTKAVNLSTNIAALVVFAVNGMVLFQLGLIAGLFNIAGNWFGVKSFIGKGSAIARPMMLVVIVLFAVKLVYELAFS